MAGLNIFLFNHELAIKLEVRRRRTTPVSGYTNRCKDGRLIILLDYDIQYYNWIVEELRYLQQAHCLGNFHTFKTGRGYHAVCLDKLSLQEYVKVLNASSVDPDFVKVPLQYGSKIWTLRFSTKNGKRPEYVETIESNYEHVRQKSSPHARMLSNLYDDRSCSEKKDSPLFEPSTSRLFDRETKMYISTYKI